MTRRRRWLVIAALVAAHVAASAWSSRRESLTYDELAHIAAGLSHVTTGDRRLTPVAAPLMKLLAGWSLASAADAPEIPLASPAWRDADHWTLGWEMLFTGRGDGRRLVERARLPFLILSALLALALYAWTRELWGDDAALATLLLYTTSCAFLAHSHYANLDLGMALATTWLLWGVDRFARSPSARHGLWVAVAAALATITKYSFPLLAPMAAAILLVRLWPVIRDRDRWRLLRFSGRTLLVVELAFALSLVAIWWAFDWRWDDAVGAGLGQPWNVERMPGGATAPEVIRFLYHRRLIPEGFANGLAYVSFVPHSQQMAYLAGEVAVTGWWYYLPVAAVLKTPLTVGVLTAIGLVARRAGRRETASLLVVVAPAAIFVALAAGFRISVGYRHLLPALPLVLALAGRGTAALWPGRRGRAAAIALLALHTLGTVRVAPHFLSQMSVLAGGPTRGHRLLVDSNIDWGQDLYELDRTCVRLGIPDVEVSYFGNAAPEPGSATRMRFLPGVGCCQDRLPRTDELRAGDVVAVSVTNLRGVYLRTPGAPELRVRVRFDGRDQTLPLAEVMALLAAREPFARAGYSILLYRL